MFGRSTVVLAREGGIFDHHNPKTIPNGLCFLVVPIYISKISEIGLFSSSENRHEFREI